jgi:predicted metal-dependent phosphoesterase TrpH
MDNAMLMQYDLHVHTSRYSECALSSPDAMCRTAIRQGLHGIALTEHDFWWPPIEYDQLQRRFPELTILHGVEYAVFEGHFLVFLPDPAHVLPYGLDLLGLAAQVRRHGGILIWAHPFRYERTPPDWLSQVRLDALEVASTNMNPAVQAMARKAAHHWRIPTVTNSDAHHTGSVGAYYNDFPVKCTSNRDLINVVRALRQSQITSEEAARSSLRL